MIVYIFEGREVGFLNFRRGKTDERKTRLTIAVGWDYARETFFAQVWDDLEHDLELIFWVGFGAKRIQAIEDLNPCLAIFRGEIPEIVAANLRADQVNLSSPSSPQVNAKHLRRILH